MSEEPEALVLATRNHLLVTADLVARGTVWPLAGRLGDRLRGGPARPRLLAIREVELTSLPQGGSEQVEEARIAADQVILAHEFVATGSDLHLQRTYEPGPAVSVRLWAASVPGLVLEGRMEAAALDAEDSWLVLTPRRIHAEGDRAEAVARSLRGLPYLLVNRDQLTALVIEKGARGARA